MLQATLTLPGMAGILLTLGMAVDANILINERIREEQTPGSATAFRAGARLSKPAIGLSRKDWLSSATRALLW